MAKLVNRVDFSAKIKEKKLGIFSAANICAIFGVSPVAATFLLHRYNKRGIVVRIKQGLYALHDIVPSLPDPYIAGRLYAPSYVSREFALSYRRIIPETVYEITSVTTKATRRFEKLGKVYSYRHIKRAAFTGYKTERMDRFSFLVADPEKAFVDTLYYRILSGQKPINRFDKSKIIKERAFRYAELFKNQKLAGILKRTLK